MDTSTFGKAPEQGATPATSSPLQPSTQPVIASPSRNAAGEIVEQGATLVGDRDEHVAVEVGRLTNILRLWRIDVETLAEEIRAHVTAEIDALLHGHPTPPLPASLKPADDVGADEDTSADHEGADDTSKDAGGEDTSADAGGETRTS